MEKMTIVTLCITFSFFVFLLAPKITQANPLYYVFTGDVTNVSVSPLNPALIEYFSEHPSILQVGAPVSFITLIDFSKQPEVPTLQVPDPNSQTPYDIFNARYVSGSSPSMDLYYSRLAPDFSFGADSPTGWMTGVRGSLFANPFVGQDFGDSPFKIYSLDVTVSQWTVGDTLLGNDNMGVNGNIDYGLKLTAIVSASAVPEPCILLLLGSDLGSLPAFRRKFHKA